jgi:hypothetical protein
MRRWLRAPGLVVAIAAAAGFACSSSERDSGDDDDDAGEAGESNQAGRGGSSGTAGSPGAGGSVPIGGSISVGGSATSAGSGGMPMSCAGEVTQAMQVPLDIYIMLDSSASMLDETSGGTTKWEAVTNALATFLDDPQSSGMGVGLQFFPLRDPSVPTTCTSNAQCGSHGPCFLTFCQNAGPDIYPCAESSECVTADGEDVGPCAPLTYCWSIAMAAGEIALCHNDAECGEVDDCVPFAQCSENTDYSCAMIGSQCTDGVEDFGECEAFNPESFCVHEASCDNAIYAAPDVDIDALPGAAPDLTDAILDHEPDGNTPTAPALAGAIEHAADWAGDHVGHRVIVLLATDGLPTECLEDPEGDPEGVDQVLEVAAAGLSADPSITTYVVGVFAPTDTAARGNLNEIAEAGGSEAAFLVDTTGNVEEEFLAALDAIRGTGLACEFQIPEPSAGSTLDYSLVNVEFTSGGSTQPLYFVPNESACDPATGGWYYDIAPAAGTPTKIIACPASCTAFQAASDGSVAIRLGCQTIVR